jgi:uncharacterized protein YdeI (YjbR/CyaY-like superfamily)
MARPLEQAEEVEVRSRAELRAWLAANHAQPKGVWLVSGKKASEHYLSYEDVVRECLAFGWVDSLGRAKDDLRSMLWIAPRTRGSNWSAINKAHVAALEAEGLMAPPGRAAVDRARADGTWAALDGVEALEVPPDLARALDEAGARATWDAFPRSVRRGVLEILLNAKRPETRAAKVATVAEATARGERPLQWRR